MKKDSFNPTAQKVQQFQDQALTKKEQKKIKGGDDIVIADAIII